MKGNILLNAGGVLKTGVVRSALSRRGLASDSVDLSASDVNFSASNGSSSNNTSSAKNSRKTMRRRSNDANPFKGIEEYALFQSLFLGTARPETPEDESRQSITKQIKRLRQLEESRIRKQKRSALATDDTAAEDSISFLSNVSNASTNVSNTMSQWAAEQSRYSQPMSKNTLSPESLEKIAILMKDRNAVSFTPLDIDNWLKMNIIFTNNKLGTQELLTQTINEIINHATTDNLPVVMEYLQRYWEKGFENITADATQAKQHTVMVLTKALEVVPAIDYQDYHNYNHHNNSITDTNSTNTKTLEAYKDFYNAFFVKFKWRASDELQDLWFRVVAKSAPIQVVDELLNNYYLKLDRLPSRQAMDAFIMALIKYTDNQRLHFVGSENEFAESVKNDLMSYRSLLASSQITPAVCEFLLLWATTLSEAYSILELSAQSDYAEQIFSQCQVDILRTVVRCSLNDQKTFEKQQKQQQQEALKDNKNKNLPVDPKYYVPIHAKAMAHMFGALNRFTNYKSGITVDALDECLLLSAKHGNSAGMYRALSMRLGETEEGKQKKQIPVSTISQVFDSFPMSSGAMAKESQNVLWVVNNTIVNDPKRDQVILYHLRTMIDQSQDMTAYTKYIGALGRCGRSDRLYWEWEDFTSKNPDWIKNDDLVIHFMTANKNANSIEVGYQILDAILEQSCRMDQRTAVTNILVKIVKYDALPTKMMLERFCTWLVEDLNKSATWELSEITEVLQETGLNVNKERLLDIIEQVRAHGNVDNAKREIQSVWSEVY